MKAGSEPRGQKTVGPGPVALRLARISGGHILRSVFDRAHGMWARLILHEALPPSSSERGR